jgi:hypothetical protein
VARNPAGEGKLPKQFRNPVGVARDFGIDLGIAAFQIGICHHSGSAMSGAANIDHIKIVSANQAIEMDVNEIQPRRRAPMSQQARLDMFGPKPLLEKGVAEQIDLPDRKVVRCLPVSVDQIQIPASERKCRRRFSHAKLPRQEAADADAMLKG